MINPPKGMSSSAGLRTKLPPWEWHSKRTAKPGTFMVPGFCFIRQPARGQTSGVVAFSYIKITNIEDHLLSVLYKNFWISYI